MIHLLETFLLNDCNFFPYLVFFLLGVYFWFETANKWNYLTKLKNWEPSEEDLDDYFKKFNEIDKKDFKELKKLEYKNLDSLFTARKMLINDFALNLHILIMI
jgi:hypothetical protein